MSNVLFKTLAFKKKLYKYAPRTGVSGPASLKTVEIHQSKSQVRLQKVDAATIERRVRQLLADKVSGNLLGLWLLVPEHLRIGSWDLLVGWSAQPASCLEPRVALQMVHEAALCVTGIRQQRCLTHKGFEVLNGLPFIPRGGILQSINYWQHTQCAKLKIFKSPWANYATPVNIISTRSLP